MKENLNEIAEIQFGPYLKGELQGTTKYLLASHFDELNRPSLFIASYVELESNESSLLQSNDVLLAGKGQRTFAWAYDEKFGPAVASSLFFVIRTNPDQVNGKYLASFLNSEKIQHQIKLIAGGHSIPSIPKKELLQLKVNIPSIEKQMEFVEMAELMEEDVRLAELLLTKKKEMRKTIINKMIDKQIK